MADPTRDELIAKAADLHRRAERPGVNAKAKRHLRRAALRALEQADDLRRQRGRSR